MNERRAGSSGLTTKDLNASVTDINVCCIGVDGNDLATIDFETDDSTQ